MSTYVIGDLQGCCDALERLLAQIKFAPGADRIWLVGDLVNRGPESLRTLRLLRALKDDVISVLGNHDLHLLAAAAGLREQRDSDTLLPIIDAPDASELLEWLRTRQIAHCDMGVLMVHAGVLPSWTIAQSLSYAAEVESALRAPSWADFLRHMFGNQPDRWSDQLKGWARLRALVNVFTRLRFCQADGTMDFATKEGAAAAPKGFMPWFDVPARASADHAIVFGHWSTLGLLMRPKLIGIDTGCVWGGQLSAVRLEDRALFQVQCS